jgi:hypothetical protein
MMIFLYLGMLVVPGPSALVVVQGLRELVARPVALLSAWLGSVAVFYLLWFGNTAAGQSYYNLPALAPICALFGLGMASILARLRWSSRAWAIGAAVLVVACAVPGWFYLFRQDRTILAATRWVREHTEPDALILCHAAHRADMQDYGPNAVFAYLSHRRTFIWSSHLAPSFRDEMLARSRYAVVTVPQDEGKMMTRIRKLRGLSTPQPPSMDWLLERGYWPLAEGTGFVVFRRQ